MTAPNPPLGLWTDEEAVVWADRSLAPSYLRGAALQTWLLARSAPGGRVTVDDVTAAGAADAEAAERVLPGLRALGLLDEAVEPPPPGPAEDEVTVTVAGVPVPLAVERADPLPWPGSEATDAEPVLRARAAADGPWVVGHAGNGLPLFVADRLPGPTTLAALARPFSSADPTVLWLPLEAWSRDDRAVLVSPALVGDADRRERCEAAGYRPGGPVTAVTGPGPDAVDGERRTIAGLVLDEAWAAVNPGAGPLGLLWVLTCLLAAANPLRAAGRYALLDAASRLVRDRRLSWASAADPDAVPTLLARLDGAP